MQTAESQQMLLVQSSLHCGIAESFQKSSRFHCCCMTRQSIIWSLFARPMWAVNSWGSVSTPLITGIEAPTESVLLQESERLGAGAFLCLGTLCVSVSVASGAQSQVKYPPPTVQSVRGACPPRPLSLWLTAPPPGHPSPLTTWKISATITTIIWVLKHQFYSVL